jgi:hypothetical protein
MSKTSSRRGFLGASAAPASALIAGIVTNGGIWEPRPVAIEC